MSEDSGGHEVSTRRDYMKYGGAVVGGGVLAGCTGNSSGNNSDANNESSDSGEGSNSDSTGDETDSSGDDSYSVTLSPVGEIPFEEPPERVATYDDHWVDHLLALGVDDRIVAHGRPDRYYTGYYDALSGVSLDISDTTPIADELDKELLYEVDADIYHMDPVRWIEDDTFDEADIEELTENVAPWFANRYSRSQSPPDGYDYQFYSLWELTEKFAEVYRVPDRATELQEIGEEMVTTIEGELPPEEERPTAGLVNYVDGEFYPYLFDVPGFGQAQYQPLGIQDAFADSERVYSRDPGANYDIEAMLEFDPDVLIHNLGVILPDRVEALRELEDDSVGSELTAVNEGNVYVGGTPWQGPIIYLFQLEMAAKQLYPEQFGELPSFDPEDGYPEIPTEEQLFDRERVAAIINGDA